MAARDQALLWVLFDTGMTVSELCALRLADLDQRMGLLSVRGKGGKERQMAFGATCLSHLRSYLRQMEPTTKERTGAKTCWWRSPVRFKGEAAAHQERCDHGVCSVPHTRGISDTTMSPQMLRHSFALRYLQAGGNPQGLQALLGYEGMAPVRQYLRWQNQLFHNQTQNKSEET